MRILNFLFAVLLGAAALAVPQMAVADNHVEGLFEKTERALQISHAHVVESLGMPASNKVDNAVRFIIKATQGRKSKNLPYHYDEHRDRYVFPRVPHTGRFSVETLIYATVNGREGGAIADCLEPIDLCLLDPQILRDNEIVDSNFAFAIPGTDPLAARVPISEGKNYFDWDEKLYFYVDEKEEGGIEHDNLLVKAADVPGPPLPDFYVPVARIGEIGSPQSTNLLSGYRHPDDDYSWLKAEVSNPLLLFSVLNVDCANGLGLDSRSRSSIEIFVRNQRQNTDRCVTQQYRGIDFDWKKEGEGYRFTKKPSFDDGYVMVMDFQHRLWRTVEEITRNPNWDDPTVSVSREDGPWTESGNDIPEDGLDQFSPAGKSTLATQEFSLRLDDVSGPEDYETSVEEDSWGRIKASLSD